MDHQILRENMKPVYTLGAITTIIALAGILLDVIIGNVTGGDLTALPQTASGRFEQFGQNCWLGLYNLDLLNIVNQIILVPAVFTLYVAHRKVNEPQAFLAMIFFLVGTTLMTASNTALPMFHLSQKYLAATSETEKSMLAAAGEALLARGAHGSPGIFPGFFLPTLGNFMMSLVMLHGKVFSKATAIIGILGNCLMMLYIILVNFVPGIDRMATAFAMPGGVLLMVWMVLYTIRLFKLRHSVS